MDALSPKKHRSHNRPQSTGKKVRDNFRDVVTLDFIHRHGAMPSKYLITRSLMMGRPANKTRDRLTQLHYEDNHRFQRKNRPAHVEGIKFIHDPDQQYETPANNQQLVYTVAEAGELLLKESNLWREDAFKHAHINWWHDLMVSTFTASIELACLAEPKKYEFFFPTVPEGYFVTYEAANGKTHRPFVGLKGKLRPNLIPDRVFAIKYLETGKTTYYFLEADTGTETQETLTDKVYKYRQFISLGEYQKAMKHEGGAVALFLLNKHGRMNNTMQAVPNANYIGFLCDPLWDKRVIPPVKDYFEQPWLRVGREALYLKR